MPTSLRLSVSARILLIALHLAAAFALVITVAAYLDRPLRFDESDWPEKVQAIIAHGAPRESFAESRMLHPIGYYGYDAYYGMLHPPLYYYALAGARLIAGDRNWVYRGVGLLCLIGSLAATWKLTGVAAGPRVPAPLRAIPVALPLLSPLVTDGSLFIDIDNSTLMVSIMVLLWRFLRPGDPYTPRRTIELSCWFCLTLLSKLTTPFLLMASLALYAALGPRRWRGLLAVFAATVTGVLLFAGLYWLYCRAFSYPPAFMFDVSYIGKRNLYGTVKSLRDVLFALRWNVVWYSPVLTLLFAAVTLGRLRRYWTTRAPEPVDLLLIFSSATFFCHVVVGALWGKYTVPAGFVAAVAAGLGIMRCWPEIRLARPATFAAAIAAVAVAAAVLPVPYVRPSETDPNLDFLTLLMDPRNVSAVLMTALALAFALAASRRWLRAGGQRTAAEVALLTAAMVIAPLTAARVVLPHYDRGPLRPFEDRGFQATVDRLVRLAPEGAAVLAPKDVGAYSRGRYHNLEQLLSEGGPALAERIARRPDVRFVVDSVKYPLLGDHTLDALDIARVESIDDFRIYVKR